MTYDDLRHMGVAPNLMEKMLRAYHPSALSDTFTVQQAYEAVSTLDTVWIITAVLPDGDEGLMRFMHGMHVHPVNAFAPTKLERVACYTLSFRNVLRARKVLIDAFQIVS